MELARIAELLAPFVPAPLHQEQLKAISTYLELLLRWNAKINLTAVRDPEQIVTRHFGESLFAAARLLNPEASLHAIDVGSGAGFPGLPLKIHAPRLRLTLIESQNKKAAFLREVARTLALAEVEVFTGRAEDYAAEGADLVTLRAVERFDSVLPVAASLLRSSVHRSPGRHPEGAERSAASEGPGRADSRGERSEPISAKGAHPYLHLPITQSPDPPRLALLIGVSQTDRARALLPPFTWEEPIAIPQSSARVLLVGAPAQRA